MGKFVGSRVRIGAKEDLDRTSKGGEQKKREKEIMESQIGMKRVGGLLRNADNFREKVFSQKGRKKVARKKVCCGE